MRAFLIAASLLIAAFASSANAAEKVNYGVCASDMVGISYVGLPQKVQVHQVLTPEIAVLVFAGQEDPHIPSSVVTVEREYFPELFAVAATYAAQSIWLGIVETVDGANQPALFMFAYANTTNGCVVSRVGNRVYFERDNAPSIFAEAIADWETKHPGSALVRQTTRPALR